MFYVPNMSDVMSDIWEGQGDMTLSQASEAELVENLASYFLYLTVFYFRSCIPANPRVALMKTVNLRT